MKQMVDKLYLVEVDKIIPYEKNPRNNKAAVEYAKNSIKRFGFRNPIVLDKDNVIVAGHTRWAAAKELGLKKVPCVSAEDLTPAQVRAYRIADNKVADMAGWDNDLLGEELKKILAEDEFDMTDFGFGDFELTMLTEDITPEPFDEAVVDEYKEKETEYLAKRRVIITYGDDDEGKMQELLGLEEIKKVVYDISELVGPEE